MAIGQYAIFISSPVIFLQSPVQVGRGGCSKLNNLLEIAWAKTQSSSKELTEVESYLITQPEDSLIPKRVQQITGISDGELCAATRASVAHQRLVRAVSQSEAVDSFLPLVIHFARFERPFLADLCQRFGGPSLEENLICTHQLALRLLKNLPRRGLRAVAGYLGLAVPELRRAADHVRATAFIWSSFVSVLREQHGVTTVRELRAWLEREEPVKNPVRKYPMEPGVRQDLPDGPGIYRMLRSSGDTLYVGKAKSLRSRVFSYFRKSTRHPDHILEMLSQARDLSFEQTASAVEAALREADKIKEENPPYNVALRNIRRTLGYYTAEFDRYTEIAKGGPGNPISREELLAKYRVNISFSKTISEENADKVIEMIENLENVDNVKKLLDLLVV